MCEMEKKIDKKVKSVSIWSLEYYNAASNNNNNNTTLGPLHSPLTTTILHLLLSSFGRFNRMVFFFSSLAS